MESDRGRGADFRASRAKLEIGRLSANFLCGKLHLVFTPLGLPPGQCLRVPRGVDPSVESGLTHDVAQRRTRTWKCSLLVSSRDGMYMMHAQSEIPGIWVNLVAVNLVGRIGLSALHERYPKAWKPKNPRNGSMV